MSEPIYLDYNGTTPLDPEVIAVMKPFLEDEFGNPSSAHLYGVEPKRAIEKARQQIADMINCKPSEIIFTSGGTESNNHAVCGILDAYRDKGNHIITSQVEHPAILEICRFVERFGVKTTYLPVDQFGMVNPRDVEQAIRPETVLISIMHANNEVGTIQPIEDISAIARKHGIVIHTDAAQSLGKTRVDVQTLGADLLSIAGHKLYAPKGIGALFIRDGVKIERFIHGAGQERGLRAGTENVIHIAGLGKACEILGRDMEKNISHLKELTDALYDGLVQNIPNIRRNGHPEICLPNTLSVSFKGLDANRILEEIGLEIAASAGAACHSDTVKISHVLEAMNVPAEWAKGTLRFSVGRMTTHAEIGKAIEVIASAIKRMLGCSCPARRRDEFT